MVHRWSTMRATGLIILGQAIRQHIGLILIGQAIGKGLIILGQAIRQHIGLILLGQAMHQLVGLMILHGMLKVKDRKLLGLGNLFSTWQSFSTASSGYEPTRWYGQPYWNLTDARTSQWGDIHL